MSQTVAQHSEPSPSLDADFRSYAQSRVTEPRAAWVNVLSYCWGGALILSMLLSPQLGPAGILLMLGIIAVGFFPVMLASPMALLSGWPLMIYPFMAVLSSLWSSHPELSLRYGVQLIVTVLAGMVIGFARFPRKMVLGVAIAQVAYFLFSFAMGNSVAVGNQGETAFSGLNASKNYFADLTILSLIATMTIAWFSFATATRKGLFVGIAALVLALMEIRAVHLAGSAGALLAMVAPVGTFLFFGIYRIIGRTARFVMLTATAIVLVASVPIALVEGKEIYEQTLRYFNKNPTTLTGRAYLWDRAEAIMRTSPMLGNGYGAFWVQGDLDPEGLWTYSMVKSRAGFSFHNTQIETRMNLGWVGYVILMMTWAAGFFGLLFQALRRPSATLTCFLAILTYELSRLTFEAVGPGPFSPTTALLIMALGGGFNRVPGLFDDKPARLAR